MENLPLTMAFRSRLGPCIHGVEGGRGSDRADVSQYNCSVAMSELQCTGVSSSLLFLFCSTYMYYISEQMHHSTAEKKIV